MKTIAENKFRDQYYKGVNPIGSAKKYYVVFAGLEIGIYDDWLAAESMVKGYKGNLHKSYKKYEDAEDALKKYLENKVQNKK